MKPRVRSQPSPTAPVWLSHRKPGLLYSALSVSHSHHMYYNMYPSLFLFVCQYTSSLTSLSFMFVYTGQSVFLSHFLPSFLSCSLQTDTHRRAHTHTHHPLSLPDSLSQPADWFSRRGSAGLHKHMALNLPSCVCWNGISFSVLFKAFCLIFF